MLGAHQRPGPIHNLLQNSVQIEAFANAEDGLCQPRETRSERLILYS